MPNRRRALAAAILSATLAVGGCSAGTDGSSGGSSGGSDAATATGTSCDLSGCTVVLQQGVDARASVLGVPVELVGVTGSQVTLKVANQQVSVPLDPNASANVGGLAVRVQSADKDRVVLKVTTGG
jgi:hypothetical protein